MTRISAFAIVCAAFLAVMFLPASGAALDSKPGKAPVEPPMLGIHYARGAQAARPGAAKPAPLLTYHGGDVIAGEGLAVTPIYWGTSWSGGADKVTALGSFYDGVGGTNYLGTTVEYTGVGGVHVVNAATHSGDIVDTSAASRSAPSTSTVLAVVARDISNPVTNGYYPVYSDQPRGHANYCAWHSWGTINGVQVQFAFFFNLDGDTGCDPKDTSTVHSEGVEALVNVTGHEMSETVTDPAGASWFDSRGEENADKCAWTFSGTPVRIGDQQWKIQGNWSNAAYTANQGYTRGCIDGS